MSLLRGLLVPLSYHTATTNAVGSHTRAANKSLNSLGPQNGYRMLPVSFEDMDLSRNPLTHTTSLKYDVISTRLQLGAGSPTMPLGNSHANKSLCLKTSQVSSHWSNKRESLNTFLQSADLLKLDVASSTTLAPN